MIKKSWPWLGSSSYEQGSGAEPSSGEEYAMQTGDSHKTYHSLSPEETSGDDESSDEGGSYDSFYEDGIFSPVDDIDFEVIASTRISSDKLLCFLKDRSSILDIGSPSQQTSFLLKNGHDVVKIGSDNDSHLDCYNVNGDIRYFNFRKKFDGFQAMSGLESVDGYRIALKNIYKQLKPHSYGIIQHSEKKDIQDLISSLTDVGFKIIKKSRFCSFDGDGIDPYVELIVEKYDLDKIAFVTISNDTSGNICPVERRVVLNAEDAPSLIYNKKRYVFSSKSRMDRFKKNPDFYIDGEVNFLCDVSKTSSELMDGLQRYSSLGKNSGMLFEYKTPRDVMYHMGGVRFPIDIIFVGSNGAIKKICKNIKPGSPATFGSSDIKYVLEINGGLSNHLGLSIGSIVRVNHSLSSNKGNRIIKKMAEYCGEENIFIESSKGLKSSAYRFKDSNILKISSDIIYKNKNSNYSKYFSTLTANKNIDVHIFNFDSALFEKKNFLEVRGSVPKRVVYLNDFLTSRDNLKNIYSASESVSLNNFMALRGKDDGVGKMLDKVLSLSKDSRNKIVLATEHFYNPELLKELVLKKVESKRGVPRLSSDMDIMNITKSMSADDILKAAYQRYGFCNPTVYMPDIIKESGVPVPDDIKDKASNSAKLLTRALDILENIESNLQHNLTEYERIQDNVETIKSSRGQYNRSVEKNKSDLESCLSKCLDAIKILNSIKDISATSEIITSLADSLKSSADYIEDVFKLVNKTNEDLFVDMLRDATEKSSLSIKDSIESISRARSFAYKDIMGIIPITEEG